VTPWRVVVTREAGLNDPLRTLLSTSFVVDEVPLTVTLFEEHELVDQRLRASAGYGHFASFVVTSRRTEKYLSLCADAVAPTCEVFTVGETTASSLKQAGFTVTRSTDEGVLSLAPSISKGPVLLLGARHPFGDLAAALRPRHDVTAVACYETVAASLTEESESVLEEADAIVIAAPSAWAVAQPFVRPTTWVVVPGDSTRQAVEASHQRVVRAWGPAMVSTLRELRDH